MATTRTRPLTGDDRRTVARRYAQLYRAGSSIRDIARDTGHSYGLIYRLLSEAGVQFRPRGAQRP